MKQTLLAQSSFLVQVSVSPFLPASPELEPASVGAAASPDEEDDDVLPELVVPEDDVVPDEEVVPEEDVVLPEEDVEPEEDDGSPSSLLHAVTRATAAPRRVRATGTTRLFVLRMARDSRP